MRLAARSARHDTTRAVTPMEDFMSSRLDHWKVAVGAVGGFIEKAGPGERRRVLTAEGARAGRYSARGA